MAHIMGTYKGHRIITHHGLKTAKVNGIWLEDNDIGELEKKINRKIQQDLTTYNKVFKKKN